MSGIIFYNDVNKSWLVISRFWHPVNFKFSFRYNDIWHCLIHWCFGLSGCVGRRYFNADASIAI